MITAILIGHKDISPYLKKIYPSTLEALNESVGRLALKLLRKVKEEKLSGQVLKNRTGTLRRSINQRIDKTETGVVASVGTNKSYAAAHEYGFTGTVTVKEHMRQIKQAFGRPISPTEVRVRTHSMVMHVPQRSFLRSSLKEMDAEIRTGLRDALKKGLAT